MAGFVVGAEFVVVAGNVKLVDWVAVTELVGKDCVLVGLGVVLVLIIGVVVVACEHVGHTEVAHISFLAQSSIACP